MVRAALAVAALLFFLELVYLLFPSSRIDDTVAALLAPRGLSLSPGCRKTLVPGLAWDDARLSSVGKGPLFSASRLAVRPLLVPLVTGRPTVAVSARVGAGNFDLEYALRGGDTLLRTAGIRLAEIPFFQTVLGGRAGGDLWSEGRLMRGPRGLNGEIRLEVRGMEFSGVKLAGFPLPDASGLTSRGMVRVTDGKARLESFTLEGDGIYMRLSGDLPGGAAANAPLALSLEIMPRAEFMERQKLVFLLLAKFMVSPGVYRVPIKGTLLKPEIL